mgnify:CR=1 FL=1
MFVDHGISSFLFGADGIHFDSRDQRHLPYLGIWGPELHAHEAFAESRVWHEAEDILGIGAVGSHDAIAAVHDVLSERLDPPVGMWQFDTYDGEAFLKLRHHTTNKGTALADLAAERHVESLSQKWLLTAVDNGREVTFELYAPDGGAPIRTASSDTAGPVIEPIQTSGGGRRNTCGGPSGACPMFYDPQDYRAMQDFESMLSRFSSVLPSR